MAGFLIRRPSRKRDRRVSWGFLGGFGDFSARRRLFFVSGLELRKTIPPLRASTLYTFTGGARSNRRSSGWRAPPVPPPPLSQPGLGLGCPSYRRASWRFFSPSIGPRSRQFSMVFAIPLGGAARVFPWPVVIRSRVNPRSRCQHGFPIRFYGRSVCAVRGRSSAGCVPLPCSRGRGCIARMGHPRAGLACSVLALVVQRRAGPRLIPSLHVGLCRMGESKAALAAFLTATGLWGWLLPCPISFSKPCDISKGAAAFGVG